jgi:hypothetical protein
MSMVPFASLPDSARLWVLATARSLSKDEVPALLDGVDLFLEAWLSHKRMVRAARELRYDRFLLVGVDETDVDLSGCSIDSLRHGMEELGARLGVAWTESPAVVYREENEIRSVSRDVFRERVRAGAVEGGTIVFDNIIGTVGALRAGRWEIPMRESWHSRAFPVPAGSAGNTPAGEVPTGDRRSS